MFKTFGLSALFALSFCVSIASAHAEIEDYSFDVEQVLSIGDR